MAEVKYVVYESGASLVAFPSTGSSTLYTMGRTTYTQQNNPSETVISGDGEIGKR